jgi:alpha-1,3-mannosyltransferase
MERFVNRIRCLWKPKNEHNAVRILQIFRQFLPATGGVERVMYYLIQALQQAGHSCDIVTLRQIFNTGEIVAPTAVIDGMQIYRLPYVGIKRYPIAPAVYSFVHSYDVIHIHAIDFFVDFLALTHHMHRKPVIVNTHGGTFHTRWLLPFKKWYFRTITCQTLQRIDAVICDSQHDYDLFQPIVPGDKLHIVPNGVHVQSFLARKKQITPGLLLGIGRMVENKHIERLINLLPALSQQFPEVHLVWIGADRDQKMTALRTRAQRLGVASRVHFTGEISDEQVLDWLSKAHLFVSASSYEAFGVATIEAMSSGTVPVVTPVGVHTEVVKPGRTGFLYECHMQQQAIDVLRYALSLDEQTIFQMGQQARQIAQRYSWEHVVKSYLDVYQQFV